MTMTLVSTVNLGGLASATWSSIPQTGTDLLIVYSTRDSDTGGAATDIYFNGSTANLSARYLRGNPAASVISSTSTRIFNRSDSNDRTANTFANGNFYICNYASTTTYKSVSSDAVEENNASDAYAMINAGLWSSNSAITSVTIAAGVANFITGSTASLYIITKGSGGATVS